MKHVFTLLIFLTVLAGSAQNNMLPVARKPFVLNKTPEPVYYPGGTATSQQRTNSRSQNVGFTIDYGLIEKAYVENVLLDNSYWYRDDQFSFTPLNSSLPVDSMEYLKWAMMWYPRIIDMENNTEWPYTEYTPSRIQMSLDTIYITFGHENFSHQNDTLVISVWDFDAFQTLGNDTGANGTLYGRITIITDTSFIPKPSSPHLFYADHYPFVPSSPIIIPAGKRFLIQVNYYGPVEDYFYFGTTRRNDCKTVCGANTPYINATLAPTIANWNSLLGIRQVDAFNNVRGVFPSTLFFNDCNNNNKKDGPCEELYEQILDIYPHITATIPEFYVDLSAKLYLDSICPGSNIELTANAAGSSATPYEYTWQTSSGILATSGGNQAVLLTPNTPATDTVIVSVSDGSAIVSDTLVIATQWSHYCNTSGVNTPLLYPELQLFPNPASTHITITATGFVPRWLALYDISGRKVSEQKFSTQMDISPLSHGVYFIEARDTHNTVRQKFIKY